MTPGTGAWRAGIGRLQSGPGPGTWLILLPSPSACQALTGHTDCMATMVISALEL